MKSRKRKILKLGIMCLMPLLTLLITISNSYAYYLNSDGNIQSDNLFNSADILNGKEFSGTDVVDNPNWFVSGYIFVEQSNSYYLSGKTSGSSFITYDDDYNVVRNLSILNGVFISSSTERFIRFNAPLSDLNNIMFNKGNEPLPYEPYGIWYNSNQFEITNYGPLYKVLNGTTARLYDFNSSQLSDLLNATPVINETIVWNNNYDFNSLMIPNVRNAILNGSDELYNVERPMVLLSLKTPLLIDNLSFYRMVSNEIRYIYLYFDDGSMESISIANASDVSTKYSIWYNQNKKSLIYIAFDNEVNFDMVSTISQPAYNMVYSDAYNNGSIDGYKEGYDDGIKQSNPISYREGYNAGYNEGIQEDFESSGFRTLITTILSYPVNMVRESLNFEFMGIHVSSIVLFIVSLGIVAFVIKRFKD